VMGKTGKGKAGCGCLLFVLVLCMVAAGVMVHPFSLKVIAGRFRHEDKLVPCDAIYVPRFSEDKNGELYTEAFREYWAGNGKVIWVEDDRLFGLTMKDIVARMAKERGIKEGALRALDVGGDGQAKAQMVKRSLAKQGIKKIIVVVPDYASKRCQMLYESGTGDLPVVLIKPVQVSYFKLDKWWRDDLSRHLMEREFFRVGRLYFRGFGFGAKEGAKGETVR